MELPSIRMAAQYVTHMAIILQTLSGIASILAETANIG
jgi:hypothetical protein